MKKPLFLVVAAALSVTAATACISCETFGKKTVAVTVGSGKNRIESSGDIVTETRKVTDFHAVEAGSAIKAVVGDYPEGELTIEADDKILPYVKISVEKGRLKIGFDLGEATICDPRVTVYVPAAGVTRLKADSASKITTEVTLTGETIRLEAGSASKIEASVSGNSCEIKCSSVAKITATVDVASLTAEADSVAKITLKGKAGKCTLEADSIAKIDARGLEAAAWKVEASSLAKISR